MLHEKFIVLNQVCFLGFFFYKNNSSFHLVAKLPLNVSTSSNKRSLEDEEEPTESTTKKRAVSKSSGPEKSSSKEYSYFSF